MSDKPEAGDTIALDTNDDGSAGKAWRRGGDGQWKPLDNVDVDAREMDHFIVRGKKQHPVGPPPWEVRVNDDDESSPTMRRGTVVAMEAWAY